MTLEPKLNVSKYTFQITQTKAIAKNVILREEYEIQHKK
jgi:hypothetical protein